MRISRDFTVEEFEAASKRKLSASDHRQVRWWAHVVLQPLRRRFGKIRITSYIRPEDRGRAHENGGGIDIVPDEASMDDVFEFIATYMSGLVGRVIHERNHIHIARPGPEAWAGYGVALVEPREGVYEPG